MRSLGFAALIASVAVTPAAAQHSVSSSQVSSSTMSRGGWNGARPQVGGWKGVSAGTRPTGWNGSRPAGNWNAPKPAGNWNNTPRPNGGWNQPKPNNGGWNQPRPNGGWNNQPKPNNGHWNNAPRPNQGQWNGGRSRWGQKVNGHWYAGNNAPGGWNGYRRAQRGYVLPSYWIQPNYYINDYSAYGLYAPQQGYTWSRYYDDAVLMDQRGQVWDSVGGLDWDRYDGGYAYDDGYYEDGGQAYAQSGDGYAYAQGGAGARYDQGYYQRRDNGLGGAAIGAGVGAVGGALIGGNVTGALIGAGVGAVGGYAIDKLEDRGRYPQVPQGYDARGYQRYSGQQGGYVSGGYWYPPATSTTVTINSAPVQTVTTTTEYIEESTSYTPVRKWRPAPKKKVWKATRCGC